MKQCPQCPHRRCRRYDLPTVVVVVALVTVAAAVGWTLAEIAIRW